MINKKILMYSSILLFVLIIGIFGFAFSNNKKEQVTEYIPQEEITNEQMRQTVINLYFYDDSTQKIVPEIRKIDAKELLNDPYKKIINLLLEGPENNKLSRLILEDTKLNKVELKDGILHIDFSEKFIDENVQKEDLIINSILKTVNQFNEISSIKILINGEENLEFASGKINFNEPFSKEII